MKTSSEKSFKETKENWLKTCLLLNLGFVPKLFGYTDEDLYTLTQGKLKQWTNGVEYYFGLGFRGIEERVHDFPYQLVEDKLIRVMHAPFSKERYPYPLFTRISRMRAKTLYHWARFNILARANPNPWHRLPKAIEVTHTTGAKKINIHAIDIILAPHSEKLFFELNKLAKNRDMEICLENISRRQRDQIRDKPEWEMAHNPIKLIEYLREKKLTNITLTIDTAHLVASKYDVLKMWESIIATTGDDINAFIGHFHLVDYDPVTRFDAEPPGKGSIGIKPFKKIISDLYRLNYTGTISLEVAPLYFNRDKYTLLLNTCKRIFSPFKPNLKEEEEYILGIIKKLMK